MFDLKVFADLVTFLLAYIITDYIRDKYRERQEKKSLLKQRDWKWEKFSPSYFAGLEAEYFLSKKEGETTSSKGKN
jgi:hypothetical protein